MDVENISLRLLTNQLPIYHSKVPIYSPLLLDIADIGLKEYNSNLYLCTLGVESLIETPNEPIDNFDVLLLVLVNQSGSLENFINALNFFTKLNFEITQFEGDFLFYSVDRLINNGNCSSFTTIHRNNYDDFTEHIRVANCMSLSKPLKDMDEFDRRVIEAEKMIAEKSSSDDNNIPFKDLISSVANMNDNGLDILKIWDINIYSLYEQMKRGQMKERYFIGLKQLLAGAEAKDVEIEYYIKKTD